MRSYDEGLWGRYKSIAIERGERSSRETRLRFADGVATNLDVANAAAQLAEIRASVPVQRKQEAQLVNALSFLVGAPPRTLSAELGPPRPIPPVPAAVPIGLPSELAERRPDIREAEARLHEATADIGIAVADFYPRITLSGSLDIQALQTSGLGSWNSRQYAFGPSISLPLFEGGRLRGTLELRKVEQKEAAIDYQRIVLKAWHEVDDALTEYNALQNQRDQLDEAVQQNKTALETAQSQYGQGAVDFLTVLTVQNQLLTTQRALVQTSADTDVALAGLYKALGGGWQQDFPVQKTAQTEEAAALASSEPTLSATATVPLQPSQAER
jgi:NodT family efflux transporter outer membrane factor (OMF) lipoprotein